MKRSVAVAPWGSVSKASGRTEGAIRPIVAELLESRRLLAATITGTVYVDLDNDGTRDDQEPRIPDVRITLTGTLNAGGTVKRTARTNSEGVFTFDALAPGTYTVSEQQPAGYRDGKDSTGFQGAVIGNDVVSNIRLGSDGLCFVRFGERPKKTPPPPPLPAAISGFVYEDDNDNGIKESGESGIGGVEVTLSGTTTTGQSVNVTMTTNAVGFYKFDGLKAGTYTVTEAQPEEYADGIDAAGSLGGVVEDDELSAIVITAGQAGVNYNFGELTPACISGRVFIDTDRDGIFDTGERAVPDVLITLTGTNDIGESVTVSTRTGTDGAYEFTGLRPGTYRVVETQPFALVDDRSIVGTAGGVAGVNVFSNIQLSPGECGLNYNFTEKLSCSCPPNPGGGDSDGASDGKSDGDSDGKSDGGSDGKSDGDSDGKSDGGSDGKSDGDSDGKSDGGSDGKSDGNSDGKSDGDSDGKSDGGSDGKSDGGSDGKSDGDSDGGSDAKKRKLAQLIKYWKSKHRKD